MNERLTKGKKTKQQAFLSGNQVHLRGGAPWEVFGSQLMKISAFKRQGLAVFEDRGGAGTRTCRAGSSTTGIDWHAGPTSTLSRRASGTYRHAGPRRPTGGRGDRISLFNLKFESFRLTEIKGPEEKILRS